MNFKCIECNTEFTINSKVEEGVYISCPLCRNLVMDGFDWDDRQEDDEDWFQTGIL